MRAERGGELTLVAADGKAESHSRDMPPTLHRQPRERMRLAQRLLQIGVYIALEGRLEGICCALIHGRIVVVGKREIVVARGCRSQHPAPWRTAASGAGMA